LPPVNDHKGCKGVSVAEARECYYLDGARNQQGPVPADEVARLIRGGTIRRDTMLWYAGLPEWQPAGQVSDFAPLFGQAPPPRPSAPPPAFPAAPPMQRMAPNAGAYQGQPRQVQAPQYGSAKSMGFVDAIKTCFRKYVDFKGRARRPEYWWFILFYFIVLTGLSILDGVMAALGLPGFFGFLGILGLVLPSLAVAVRRLHDTDRSGWMLLISLIPLVGSIIVIVFLCQRGTDGPNRFGSDDLAAAAEFD
jgi:uncharacterized membrane protein YhaH (DUF805 family)